MTHIIICPFLVVSRMEIEPENSDISDLDIASSSVEEKTMSLPTENVPEGDSWETMATDRLTQMYLMFEGSQWHTFSVETDLKFLVTKLCYASYGLPEEFSDNIEDWYTEDQRNSMELIKNKILEAAGNPKEIMMGFIHVVCKDKGNPFMVPVYRIFAGKTPDMEDISKYVDTNGRVYKDWEDWKNNNKLPEVEYCYPKGGYYTCKEGGYVFDPEKAPILEFGKSPACKITTKTAGVTDVAFGVASLVSGGIFAASVFTPIGPMVLTGSVIAGGISAVYGSLRSATRLYDKGTHNESLKDLESITSWIAIAATPLNFANGIANGVLVAGAESGRIFSDMQRFGATALMWTTFGANSAMVVSGFANLYEKKSRGQLSSLDVAQFCISVFFFTNTLIQPKTATGVIQQAQEQHIDSFSNSMSDSASASMMEFVDNNRASNNILENSKIIRTLNRMEEPGTFFGSLAGKDVVIGGRKGKTVLVKNPDGDVHRINPNKFIDAVNKGNTAAEFPSFQVNPNIVSENNSDKAEVDAKKLVNFDQMSTSEKSKFQNVFNMAAQYDRQIMSISMIIADKLGVKSGEAFLTIVKIVLAYCRGDFRYMASRKLLNILNGKNLEDFISEIREDCETARTLASNAALKFTDPWKATYLYRKYGEDFVNRMPSNVRFYLGEAAKNLYKNENLVPIDRMYDFQNAYTFHKNGQFGVVFITSRGNPIATTFTNEDLLKCYIEQIHYRRTYGLTANLSTTAAFQNLVVQTGLGAVFIRFDYSSKLFESPDDFEDREEDPEIQNHASEMLQAMFLDN